MMVGGMHCNVNLSCYKQEAFFDEAHGSLYEDHIVGNLAGFSLILAIARS